MNARTLAAALATTILAACGGGGESDSIASDPAVAITVKVAGFVTWQGSAGGEVVLDANGERFRVATLTDGQWCLFEEATQAVVVNYCRAAAATPLHVLNFAGMPVSVALARTSDGMCRAALTDPQTRRLIDVLRDASGQLRHTVSSISPTYCQ